MSNNLKTYYVLIGFIISLLTTINAQDQKIADGLQVDYKNSSSLNNKERMFLLQKLAFNELNDLNAALNYSNELIELAIATDNKHYIYEGYLNKGNAYRLLGDVDKALESLFKSSDAARKAKNLEDEAVSYTSIADVYSEIGNSENAELYYDKGIAILRELDEPISLASALFNAGDELFNNKKYAKALKNFEESGLIFENENYLIGSAYTNGNIGMIYAEQGKHILAEQKINEAITVLEEYEDFYAISEYLTYMSDIYLKQNDSKSAVVYANRSLELAKKNGLKKQIAESNLKLYEIHQKAGNPWKSLDYYKNHIIYRDSVINVENVEKSANLRTNFEVSQKQLELDLSKQKAKIELDLSEQKATNQRNIAIGTAIGLILSGILVVGLFRRNKLIQKTKKIIEEERDRSDSLLLNILPEETAAELKENGKVEAQKFESVTVLFSDFKGFTHYSEHLSPSNLVKSIDFYFSKFDEIMEKYGLEKIKTIGDAYMCAGGLPNPIENHALKMVHAAFEITQFVAEAKNDTTEDRARFDIRVGINTGPLVAGVVGTKKFAYDIWGDSVNIASRMESNSEPGRINISEYTYELIKDKFDCEHRGEIEVKNRGWMKMYFVNGPKNGVLATNIIKN